MNKYDDSVIYKGNLRRKINSQESEIIKKDIYLTYFPEEDMFGVLKKTFPYLYSLLLEEEKLTEKEKIEYEKIVKENTYPYKNISEGELFIDEISLTQITKNKKIK